MFKITSYGELSGWRPIPISMTISRNAICPCDGNGLSNVCQFIQNQQVILSGPQVGACDQCSYVGYIDRPTQQWFCDFYASEWDANARDDQPEVRKLVRKEASNIQPGVSIALACKPKQDSRILEFGCGYGVSLAQLRHGGYTEVFGVEPCQHRSDIARSEFGLGIAADLAEVEGEYDVIYSSHVLEHCYDPHEVIGHCARLQPTGGRLAINVPDAWHEPTMGQLLFLPHLHSFTEISLCNLFARHGYEATSVHRENGGLCVVGVKNGCGMVRQYASDATVAVVAKFRKALSVEGNQLWWNSDNDETAAEPNPIWKRPRCINIEPCKPITGHPVEIQFQGPVQLCVK